MGQVPGLSRIISWCMGQRYRCCIFTAFFSSFTGFVLHPTATSAHGSNRHHTQVFINFIGVLITSLILFPEFYPFPPVTSIDLVVVAGIKVLSYSGFAMHQTR